MGGHLTEQAFMHHKLSNESPTGLAQKRGVLLISILSSCSPLLWFGLVHSSYISVSQYCEHYCIVKIESQLVVSVSRKEPLDSRPNSVVYYHHPHLQNILMFH
jgi:hypothetical protein